jgi:DNA-binding MarR family transcriptional regulator/N-acetylglutamate synthase-like GNAT family acetyltransferase
MDFLKQLGSLAIASRLRRLADRMSQDVTLLYRDLNLDFEPRWFTVFCLLSQEPPMGVVDIAKMLGVSHPAVNQIAGELIERGLVYSLKDATDKRKRLLTLTDEGRELWPILQDTGNQIQAAVRGMLNATGMDVMGMLETLETVADEHGIYARYCAARQADKPRLDIQIVEYRPEYKEAFKRLNLEWIEKYFAVEPEDEKLLNNPEAEILAQGGIILFALGASHLGLAQEDGQEQVEEEDVLGTCALLKKEDGSFELAKMAVTEKARGQQIGKQLLAASIEKARALEAEHLELETNSQLVAAMNLYQKLGFVLMPSNVEESSYNRVDTRMRLIL